MAEYLSQQLPEVSSVHLLLAHIRKDAHAQRRGKRGGESSRGTCPQLWMMEAMPPTLVRSCRALLGVIVFLTALCLCCIIVPSVNLAFNRCLRPRPVYSSFSLGDRDTADFRTSR